MVLLMHRVPEAVSSSTLPRRTATGGAADAKAGPAGAGVGIIAPGVGIQPRSQSG